jgi:phosphohistidine phosphatase SixA
MQQLCRFVAIAWFVLAGALPAFSQTPASPEWLSALRNGGYVLVLRHGATNPDQADTDPLNPQDISKQRLLSEQGRALAASVGESMHKLNIPAAEVRTSLFNRAVETGKLLGYGEVVTSLDYTEGGLVVSPKENDRRKDALRAAVASVPPAGSNVVIVTHKPNILDAFGKDWFEVKEGEMSIFKPDGKGGYTPVARVPAGEWAKLAGDNK